MGNNPPIAYNRDPPGGDPPPTLILCSGYLETTFVSWIRRIDDKFLNLDRNACIFLAVFQSDNGRGPCVVCPPENIIVSVAILTIFAGDCTVQVVPLLKTNHWVDRGRLFGRIEQEIFGIGDGGC